MLRNFNMVMLEESVLNTVRGMKFKARLSANDRILLILYDKCKMENIPLLIDDILKYSNLKKEKLLRIHRDEFEYKKKETSLLMSSFNRAADYATNNYNMKVGIQFEEAFGKKDQFVNTNFYKLCLVMILAEERNKSKAMKEYLRQNRHIVSKLNKL
ncbi:hypothetical protein ECANGB1_1012 [Enterospora canceri]|uniref:Uncharacterized protein n=1 Tax=Enterospora canceri TaxID=1081671 RepID=A0A1Y1S438_9MICR|nr:hypothetical protein ECANGB1_1012 [Enterospora canceri]